MRWAAVTIDSIRSNDRYSLVGGPFGSNLTTRDYVDDGVPVIRGGNLPEDSKFLDDNFVFVSEEKADQLAANLAFSGDVVFTQRGTLGQVGLIPDGCAHQRYVLSQSQMKLRVDRAKAEPTYIYYFFRQPETVQHIRNHDSSSGVPHINLAVLKAMRLPLPPLGQQRRIVETIGAYDDLVDNNRRRIKLLEDSVRLLFDEWFVRYRFPGAPPRLSPSDVPAGWRREPLGRLTSKIGSGATPRGGEGSYVDEGIPLIRSQNVYDYEFIDEGLAFIDDDQAARLDGVAVVERDVLLNITGASVGRCCMVPSRLVPARVNQHVMIIRVAAAMDPHYLLCAINSDERKRQLLSYAQTGSTREALTKDLMSAFEVLVPDAATLAAFGQIARDAFDLREVLAAQNIKLRAARDLLLPRLMSGELAV
jgi:type I restriction enzyme, S subunit